nr:uncharacterized protein LOC105471141 [Macaca nemestrina]
MGDQSGPGQPAQSVSAAAGARQGPARTILTADLPPARAPATLLGAAGTRGPFRQGAEPVAVARSWRGRQRPLLTRNGSHTALREEAGRLGYGALGSRGAARAPPSSRLRFFRSCWACAAFLRREETLPSQLCDIRLHSRADVSRYITTLPQRGTQDSHTMTPSSSVSPATFGHGSGSQRFIFNKQYVHIGKVSRIMKSMHLKSKPPFYSSLEQPLLPAFFVVF